jgi:uncharacterized protein
LEKPHYMECPYPNSPKVTPVMLQGWDEICFFHWSCNPEFLQRRLPPQLQIDTYDGKAWISLTPFLLTGLRPPLIPRVLGLSFPETNLRTYVIGPEGPAIWFFSLDVSRFLAMAGARTTYGLPYFWADMRVRIDSKDNFYFSNRGGRVQTRIRIQKKSPVTEQSALDIFLTARYRLYSTLRGRLITAAVQHAPWRLNHIRILQFEENIRAAMGVEWPSADFLAHHSDGVETKIGVPRYAASSSSDSPLRC